MAATVDWAHFSLATQRNLCATICAIEYHKSTKKMLIKFKHTHTHTDNGTLTYVCLWCSQTFVLYKAKRANQIKISNSQRLRRRRCCPLEKNVWRDLRISKICWKNVENNKKKINQNLWRTFQSFQWICKFEISCQMWTSSKRNYKCMQCVKWAALGV